MIQIAVFLLKSSKFVRRPTCTRTKIWLKRHSWEISKYFVEDGLERTFSSLVNFHHVETWVTLTLFLALSIYILKTHLRKMS